jgi:1-acyl-sn-glycerol-3-phosphate acyltransferase
MSGTRRVFRWMTAGFFSYFSWLVVNILLAAVFPLLAALRLAGAHSLVREIVVASMRGYFLKILPLFGLSRIDALSDIDAPGRISRGLVVINHTSWLDALIVIALVPNVRPLVSTRYGGVPLISTTMRWLGCIFVNRRDRDSVASAVETIRRHLREGVPVAVFPEGTRSQIGTLKPFKEVFFSLAVEEAAVIEPILLSLDTPFLGPGAENFLTDRKANLKVLKLSSITADTGETGRDLAYRTRRTMRKALMTITEQTR